MNLAPTQDISFKREIETITEEVMDISQDADQSQSSVELEDVNTSQSETTSQITDGQLPMEDNNDKQADETLKEKMDSEKGLINSHLNSQSIKKKPKRATNKYNLTLFCLIFISISIYTKT